MTTSASLDVVVPTYKRPELLERCLDALAAQVVLADRVIVVARAADAASREVVARFEGRVHGLGLTTVTAPGVLAAMSAGVAASNAEVIAFTDDDAAPHPDWVARLLDHFKDPSVGAIGGRDLIPGQLGPLTDRVGYFERSGRLVGNHHLGAGPAREVDVLKGVNMAFRAVALALPTPGVLRGSGAQVDFEIMCCAYAKRRGWRVLYDPAVEVDHEGAPRDGADQRIRPACSAIFDASYNSIAASLAPDAESAARRTAYGVAIGTGDRPGFGRAAIAMVRRESEVLRRFPPSLTGRLFALLRLLRPGHRADATAMLSTGDLRRPRSSRTRVALVAHDVHDRGGMERACAELIRHCHKDIAFTVVAVDLAPELCPLVERWIRIRVPARPFPVKFGAFFILAGRVLRRLDVDLVHTVGAIVPNRVDVAAIHFCHAGHRQATGRLAPQHAPILRRANTTLTRALALLAERWCYRPSRLRSFAVVSNGVADEVREHYPGIAVTVTPNGVDTSRFHSDVTQRMVLRARQRVREDQCVVLFVGGDWDRKGLELILEAVAKARAEGADVVLWVVGPGNEARFGKKAAALGIKDFTLFFGARSDTEQFYQAADCFVLPSAYETFSIVCFEAAASGLPLVIPPLHGASELVGADEGGLIVERNVTSIATALVTLAEDPLRRDQLGAEALRKAGHFTWQASAESVGALYHSLMSEDSP